MARFDTPRARRVLLGAAVPRRRLAALVAGLLAALSVGFLLRLDVLLPGAGTPFLLALLAATPAYAGWTGAGLLPGVGGLWLLVCWRYAVPPLVGYARGSMAQRYAHPRLVGVDYSPRGEFVHGLEAALTFGVLLAVALGLVGCGLGALCRAAVDRLAA